MILPLLLSIALTGAASEPQPLLYNNGLLTGPGFCPNGGLCVPHMYCAVHYAEHLSSSSTTPCWLALNTPGLCCYPTHPSVPKVGRSRGSRTEITSLSLTERFVKTSRESSEFQITDRV